MAHVYRRRCSATRMRNMHVAYLRRDPCVRHMLPFHSTRSSTLQTAAWRLPLRVAWVTHTLNLCNAVKAAAQLTPLVLRHGVARPQRCLPARGTSHMMLLTSSSTFSTELLRAVNRRSVRLAGVIAWCTCSQHGQALLQHVRTLSMGASGITPRCSLFCMVQLVAIGRSQSLCESEYTWCLYTCECG